MQSLHKEETKTGLMACHACAQNFFIFHLEQGRVDCSNYSLVYCG